MSTSQSNAVVSELSFPVIDPVFEPIHRPFWSVMITSYNRTEYLSQCIQSVLAQGFPLEEMQIEVVDDHSTKGNIEEIAKTVGQGRVTFYRQPKNVGISENWNTCIRRARGHWVHILSDDDQVLPSFYESYRQQIDRGSYLFVVGQSIFVNEKEEWIGISPAMPVSDSLFGDAKWVLATGCPIRAPGIVVAREAYERVGGFIPDLVFALDWEMWARLASTFEVGYVNRPYSLYREHDGSASMRLVLEGTVFADRVKAAKVIQTRFSDPEDKKRLQSLLSKHLSDSCQTLSGVLIHQRYYGAAVKQAVLAIKTNPSFYSFKNLFSVLVKICAMLVK
jgi:glycosyltransferase involved in cell wall biosynthesis